MWVDRGCFSHMEAIGMTEPYFSEGTRELSAIGVQYKILISKHTVKMLTSRKEAKNAGQWEWNYVCLQKF